MTLELHETAAIRAILREDWATLQPRLTAIAQRVVRRREIAEEVVSSTVVELIERVDAGESIRDPAAYLARGVRFRAIDVVRSRDGQAVVGTDVADEAIASITDARLGTMAIDDREALAPVREAFGGLSERHREVLLRTVIGEEPPREVARDWGMTANAVAGLALRARKALRAELKAVLMERAGGACAIHARSTDRAALAHVARCDHCLDVRAGRGVGRWVFATLPALLGGGAAVGAPGGSPHAAAATRVGRGTRGSRVAIVSGVAVVASIAVALAASALEPVEETQPTIAAASGANAAPEPTASGRAELAAAAAAAASAMATAASTDADDGAAAANGLGSIAPRALSGPVRVSVPGSPSPAAQAWAPAIAAPGDVRAPGDAGSEPVAPDPVDPDPVGPDPIDPDPVDPDPVDPDPVDPDPVDPDPIGPDPIGPAAAPTLAVQWDPQGEDASGTRGVLELDGLVVGSDYVLDAEPDLEVMQIVGLSCRIEGGRGVCTAAAQRATLVVRVLDAPTCGVDRPTFLVRNVDAATQHELLAPLDGMPCRDA